MKTRQCFHFTILLLTWHYNYYTNVYWCVFMLKAAALVVRWTQVERRHRCCSLPPQTVQLFSGNVRLCMLTCCHFNKQQVWRGWRLLVFHIFTINSLLCTIAALWKNTIIIICVCGESSKTWLISSVKLLIIFVMTLMRVSIHRNKDCNL